MSVDLLEVPEVIDRLKLSRTQLHRYVRSGELTAVKFGRRTMFCASDLEEFIKRHKTRIVPAVANIRSI